MLGCTAKDIANAPSRGEGRARPGVPPGQSLERAIVREIQRQLGSNERNICSRKPTRMNKTIPAIKADTSRNISGKRPGLCPIKATNSCI